MAFNLLLKGHTNLYNLQVEIHIFKRARVIKHYKRFAFLFVQTVFDISVLYGISGILFNI